MARGSVGCTTVVTGSRERQPSSTDSNAQRRRAGPAARPGGTARPTLAVGGECVKSHISGNGYKGVQPALTNVHTHERRSPEKGPFLAETRAATLSWFSARFGKSVSRIGSCGYGSRDGVLD